MAKRFSNYVPPVGFYFSVSILGKGETPFPPADASFQEVSGISVSMQTEEIMEGGQNRFVHRVPGRTKYEDLVLKRGLIVRSSSLALWCKKEFSDNLTRPITPRTIKVSLLDANPNGAGPLMTWVFYNAYPIKWDVSSFDAQKSEIVVESITFAYNYFEKQDEAKAKGYPYEPPQYPPSLRKPRSTKK